VVQLFDGALSPALDIPSLSDLQLQAKVSPAGIHVESLTGEMGGAPFRLTGTLTFAGETGPKTDFHLEGTNLLLYRSAGLRVRADTDLSLAGPVSRMRLSGTIALSDSRFSKNYGLVEGVRMTPGVPQTGSGLELFSIRQPPFRNLRFDVRIIAKEPFEINNNLARGALRPDLLLTGDGLTPLLIGKVYLDPTRLYLPAGRLNMKSGLIRFERSDPGRPELDMLGTASMLGYDITALIEGPYDEPVITLSSVPPLSDEDVLNLLLTGQPPKSTNGRSRNLNVAVFLGRDMISRLFGKTSDEAEELILDRFDVDIGRNLTESGEETIDAQFRVIDNVLRENDSVYLTGERDRFDYINGGIKLVFRFR
jgi:translocation and assembly module TamB